MALSNKMIYMISFLISIYVQRCSAIADLSCIRMKVKQSGNYISAGRDDGIMSTLSQDDDEYSRFLPTHQADGSYTLKVQATDRFLFLDNDLFLSGAPYDGDGTTEMYFEEQGGSGTYKITVKGSNNFWHADDAFRGDKKVSTRYQPRDNYGRFLVETCTPSTPPHYVLLPAGSARRCSGIYERVPFEQCVTAGLTLGGSLRTEGLVTGSNSIWPRGCFLSSYNDNGIGFSTNENPQANENYSPICILPDYATATATCEGLGDGGRYRDVNSEEECEAAHLALAPTDGYNLKSTSSISNAPCGCTYQPNSDLDFWGVEGDGCRIGGSCTNWRGANSDIHCYCKRVITQPTVYYRIANAGYTGWRPMIAEFWMKDASGSTIQDGTLICSGHQEGPCENAVGGDILSVWQPQCQPCNTEDAWIGYEVNEDVAIVEAYAKGLGNTVYTLGGYNWNAGVILQKSQDLGTTWINLGTAKNSDRVVAGHDIEKETVYYRIANGGETSQRPTVSEFWMKDATGNIILENVNDARLICSGTGDPMGPCEYAINGDDANGWKPQCQPCLYSVGWIGYAVSADVVIVEAYASNLGVLTESNGWDGGVVLQRSSDSGTTWVDIGFRVNSDRVAAGDVRVEDTDCDPANQVVTLGATDIDDLCW